MTRPLLAFTGWSGTGKTTLLKKLIVLLNQRGIRPGLIKHTHHDMEIDIPGKDSYELRKAGASQVIVYSQQRWAHITETRPESSPDLATLALQMNMEELDIILVEGFKNEPVEKIVLWRTGCGELAPLLDRYVIAVACDETLALDCPVLDINRAERLADFIARWLDEKRRTAVAPRG